jgi:mannosyltransferase OCH1-like enzyme
MLKHMNPQASATSRFPQVLHAIWYQSADKVPPHYQAAALKLRAMNPTWAYQVWDDTSMQANCAMVSQACLDKYLSFPFMHQKIDLGRYVAVYLYGGLSVDMDVDSIKPLDTLPVEDGKSLIVSNVPVTEWETYVISFGARNTLFNNAMILAQPQHPQMLRLINYIVQRPTVAPAPFPWNVMFQKVYQIMHTTGPLVFTEGLSSGDTSTMQVLSNVYFEPCYGRDVHCQIDDRTVLFHQHAASWFPAWFVGVSMTFSAVRPFLPILFLVLVIVIAKFIYRRK